MFVKFRDLCFSVGLNNIYFEKLSHTNLQTEQSGFVFQFIVGITEGLL